MGCEVNGISLKHAFSWVHPSFGLCDSDPWQDGVGVSTALSLDILEEYAPVVVYGGGVRNVLDWLRY